MKRHTPTIDYKRLENYLRIIKSVLTLRYQGKTFREIGAKLDIYPQVATDIWHTNKDYDELKYLKP